MKFLSILKITIPAFAVAICLVSVTQAEFGDRGMHLTPEAPTYSMRAHGGLPAYAGGV